MQSPSPFLALLKSANLTSEQRTQIQRILQSNGAETGELVRQLRALQEQISAKLLGPGPVAAADLSPLAEQATRIREQMELKTIDTSLAIRKVLTAEQLQRLVAVHQRLESLRKEIEELIGPGPGGPGGMMLLPPE
jgi:Spy/CpxP family protein refolding chaperone